ncbi:MAG TPA: hypothetical protein VEL76_37535, partial [Gemmataceae bacterium]|nr:hypothetical protein [Gemmataceae bacterium]
MATPKSEIRNSKSETNPKSEQENPKLQAPLSSFSGSDFGFVSDFEFRISDFLQLPAEGDRAKMFGHWPE